MPLAKQIMKTSRRQFLQSTATAIAATTIGTPLFAAEEKPKRRTRAKKKADDAPVEPKPAAKLAATAATPEASNEDVPGEARRGWWQRTFG